MSIVLFEGGINVAPGHEAAGAIDGAAGLSRDQLFDAHYGLAVSLARRFGMKGGWGEPIDDLTQVALLGLVRAVDRYDQERGVPFSAFATTTIVGELKHHLRDRSWTIRPPRRVQDLYRRIQEATLELTHEFGQPPALAEIGARVDASADEVVEALGAGSLRRPASLDSPIGGEDDRPLASRLRADDKAIDSVDDRLSLSRLLARLPERQRRMVRLRFIEGLTQNEIAECMSLSQAHVQRLLVRSLDQLRALAKAS